MAAVWLGVALVRACVTTVEQPQSALWWRLALATICCYIRCQCSMVGVARAGAGRAAG